MFVHTHQVSFLVLMNLFSSVALSHAEGWEKYFKLNQDGYHCFNVRQMMDRRMVDDGLIGPGCDEGFWKDDSAEQGLLM